MAKNTVEITTTADVIWEFTEYMRTVYIRDPDALCRIITMMQNGLTDDELPLVISIRKHKPPATHILIHFHTPYILTYFIKIVDGISKEHATIPYPRNIVRLISTNTLADDDVPAGIAHNFY